ncbi:MAG: hypothetical protein GX800_04465 [Clostridiaceae bacterium]|nr:hypothetical protein [Clostridiaceae bacterium]
MILLSTAQVMRGCDVELAEHYNAFITEMLSELFSAGYYNEQKRAMTEFVSADSKSISGPKSRLINPGHAIEGAWFIMAEALYRKDDAMLKKALNIIEWSMESGWDKECGGLYSFIDIEGKPAEQLEWDMKLWWPQTEGIIANVLAWRITGDEKYKTWFEMLHSYAFEHFCDDEHGEWYGYLHRDGSVSNTLKGNLFKGPYHLPRMLILSSELLLGNAPVVSSLLNI